MRCVRGSERQTTQHMSGAAWAAGGAAAGSVVAIGAACLTSLQRQFQHLQRSPVVFESHEGGEQSRSLELVGLAAEEPRKLVMLVVTVARAS